MSDVEILKHGLEQLGLTVSALDRENYQSLYQEKTILVAYVAGKPFNGTPALLSANEEVCKMSLWLRTAPLYELEKSGVALDLLRLNYTMPYGRIAATVFAPGGISQDLGLVLAETMFFWRTALSAPGIFQTEVSQRAAGLVHLFQQASQIVLAKHPAKG